MKNILIHDLRMSDLVTVFTNGASHNSMLLKVLDKFKSEHASIEFESLRLSLSYNINMILFGLKHVIPFVLSTISPALFLPALPFFIKRDYKSRIISFFQEKTGLTVKIYGPNQDELEKLRSFLLLGENTGENLADEPFKYIINGQSDFEGEVKVTKVSSIKGRVWENQYPGAKWESIFLIHDTKHSEEVSLSYYPENDDFFNSKPEQWIYSYLKSNKSRSPDYSKKILNIPKTFEYVVTNNYDFKKVIARAHSCAKRRGNVLLLGKTGTGKELFANAIMKSSDRNENEFRALNCATFSKEMLESHLFGHVKGAFTGATSKKIGILEKVDGGTLFLDEIGDLHPEVQPKLLRALESGEYYALGGTELKKSDFRLISATHKNVEDPAIFRPDLFFRISHFKISLPTLSERGANDIKYLTEFFRKKIQEGENDDLFQDSYITDYALELIGDFDWPGNVRQLSNFVTKLIDEAVFKVLYEMRVDLIDSNKKLKIDAEIVSEMLKREVTGNPDNAISKRGVGGGVSLTPKDLIVVDHNRVTDLNKHITDIERAFLESAIEKSRDQKEAAKILGVKQDWVSRKCKDLGMDYKQIKSRKRSSNHDEE